MITIKTIQLITSEDFTTLVRDTYNRPYNLQQTNGCMGRQDIGIVVPDIHNGNYETGMTMEEWLEQVPTFDQYDYRADWERTMNIERHEYPKLGMLLNDLHIKGLIPEGEYTLQIDW